MLGNELRKAREEAGMTQEQVASSARVTREYVSHLERDEYSPTLEVLLRLAAAMKTQAWKLVRRIEEDKTKKS